MGTQIGDVVRSLHLTRVLAKVEVNTISCLWLSYYAAATKFATIKSKYNQDWISM
jgi:hypothetical protein